MELSAREQQLIEQLGIMRALLEIQEDLMLALVVRLGGTATISSRERHHCHTTYSFEKNVRIDDMTNDTTMNARLK